MVESTTPNGQLVRGKIMVIVEAANYSSKELEESVGALLGNLPESTDYNVFIVPDDEYPYE